MEEYAGKPERPVNSVSLDYNTYTNNTNNAHNKMQKKNNLTTTLTRQHDGTGTCSKKNYS